MSDAATPCPACGFAASLNFCAECGAALATAPTPSHATARRVARALVGPFADYLALLPTIIRPRWLVDEVEADRVPMTDLIGFAVAAAGVAALVNWCVPSQQLFATLPPIVADLAEALVAVGLNLILNLPIAWVLSLGNPHTVPLRRFLIVATALLALLFPLIDLADGLLTLAGVSNPDLVVYPLSLVWYVIAYARLYRRPWWQVALWIAGGIVVLAIVATIVLTALGLVKPG